MDPVAASELRKAYRTTAIIGLAMFASLGIYAAVVEIIKKQNAPFAGFQPLPADVFNMLRYVLLTVAAIEFLVIPVVNRAILSGKGPAGNAQPGQYGQLVSAAVVSFALCESVAIYGLVLFLINGSTQDFYLFFAISLVYYTVYFPRYTKWEAWAEERAGGRRTR